MKSKGNNIATISNNPNGACHNATIASGSVGNHDHKSIEVVEANNVAASNGDSKSKPQKKARFDDASLAQAGEDEAFLPGKI